MLYALTLCVRLMHELYAVEAFLHSEIHIQKQRQRHRHKEGDMDTETGMQADRQASKQANRQTVGHTDTASYQHMGTGTQSPRDATIHT